MVFVQVTVTSFSTSCQFHHTLPNLNLDAGLLIGEFLEGASSGFEAESGAHHLGQNRMRRSRENFNVRHFGFLLVVLIRWQEWICWVDRRVGGGLIRRVCIIISD